jgi:hypothetical protein
MCVIIHQPAKAHLDKDEAKIAWNKNPDGGGFAFIGDTGELIVEKHMDFPTWWKQFENARSWFPRRDFLIHMRIATHGTKDLFNVHPFQVDEHTVMAHNGIIHGVPDYHDGRSDTRVFVDEVLPRLPVTWLDEPYITTMVEKWLGWSKLMFLTNNPLLKKNVYILNESDGKEHNKMWWSNDSFSKPYTHVSTYVGQATVVGRRKESSEEAKAYWEGVNARLANAKVAPSGMGWESNGYSESKAFWEQRDRERDERLALESKASVVVTFIPGSIAEKENLTAIREDSQIYGDLWYDEIEKVWECFGCDEQVDTVTGECDCWNKVCLDCTRFAAECLCPAGYSTNLTYAESFDFEKGTYETADTSDTA